MMLFVKKFCLVLAAASIVLFFASCSSGKSSELKKQYLDVKILVNHIGFERTADKTAVIEAPKTTVFGKGQVIDKTTGKEVFNGPVVNVGGVDNWKNRYYFTFDFTPVQKAGTYVIAIKAADEVHWSSPFKVGDHLLRDKTVSDIIYYFKSQRCTAEYDRTDRAVPFFGGRKGTVDAHGGWYDASGDTSKYLSHLSYANYMCPQQSPLLVWTLLDARRNLKGWNQMTDDFERRITDEALHGADFLVRMQDKEGYFYSTVFDQWSKVLEKRMICAYKSQNGERSANYQAAYREGGGMAIAALARAAKLERSGDYKPENYLAAAEKGFKHLEANNLKYVDDGKENIIDDYCALLAALELFNTTAKAPYLEVAEKRAKNLVARLSKDEKQTNWWRADDKGEMPFFHGADAGLPVISLLRFLDVAKDKAPETAKEIVSVIRKSLEFELAITSQVVNPFGLAREYVKPVDGEKKASFFYPHKNLSGYWWQGENARLASMASAARKALPLFKDDAAFCKKLEKYAHDQLNWILGRNPYDMCMMQGHGRNNPFYELGYINAPGGICNGITAGFSDESDIAFLPEEVAGTGDHRWRWSEQWLSHPMWFLSAVTAK